jgi:hypothetical protein
VKGTNLLKGDLKNSLAKKLKGEVILGSFYPSTCPWAHLQELSSKTFDIDGTLLSLKWRGHRFLAERERPEEQAEE